MHVFLFFDPQFLNSFDESIVYFFYTNVYRKLVIRFFFNYNNVNKILFKSMDKCDI